MSSPSVSSFSVSVPVLSQHSMSMPAISSMETRRETMAFMAASREAPTAMVMESTAGSATGIAATVRIKANSSVSISPLPRNKATKRISATRPSVMRIRKFPMRNTACWKCERCTAVSTNCAVLPK